MDNKQFFAKYGSVEVEFSHYYKFSFTYRGVLPDGNTLHVTRGGDSDDIYKLSVTAGESKCVRDVYPDSGYVLTSSGHVDDWEDDGTGND